jgi:hypothetical protein
MTKRVRRSILDSRKELEPLSLGRSLTQRDINDAVSAEMTAQEARIRKQYGK